MKLILKRIVKILKYVLIGGLGIIISAVLVLTIWNQVQCFREQKELKKIGKDITVDGHKLRVYEVGEGGQTIIMLSGLGTYSPIIDFKPLADSLGKNYKVVILEYSGYGLSEDTDEERTTENIVEEIRGAMDALKIEPPYILMPHSISGIYAMQYVQSYPEEVEAIVGIDMSMPNQTKYEEISQISKSMLLLAKLLDVTGITRLQLLTGDPYLTGMAAGGYYTDEDMRHVKAIYAKNSASKSLIDENNRIVSNCEPLYDCKYPERLPVLAFISKDTCKQFDSYMNKLGKTVTWEGLHEEAFTNVDIQKISILEGEHYLHWTQIDEISRQTKQFLNGN